MSPSTASSVASSPSPPSTRASPNTPSPSSQKWTKMFRFASKGRTSSGLSETSSPTQQSASHLSPSGGGPHKGSSPRVVPDSADSSFGEDGTGRWREHSHDEDPHGLAPSLPPFRVGSVGGSSGLGGSLYDEPASLLSTPPLSIGSFEGGLGYDENDSTVNLAAGAGASSSSQHHHPHSPSAASPGLHPNGHGTGQQAKSDRYRSLGKKNTMSYLTTTQQQAAHAADGSSSQARLVSSPALTPSAYANGQANGAADGAAPYQPAAGSATARWIRRVASAPNTKLFGASLSFKHAPPSPSLVKSGAFFASTGETAPPPLPPPGTIPANEAVVTLSSDTESSTRSASGGGGPGGRKKSGGQRALGVLGVLGSGKNSSQSVNTSSTAASQAGGAVPGKNFRRTYSSNSIKLREVRHVSARKGRPALHPLADRACAFSLPSARSRSARARSRRSSCSARATSARSTSCARRRPKSCLR